ncbi:hypothetical protein BC938DRAFT_472534 [Jimgerdemannia flammicorona]|uniref:Uncharacterized protein n=1 Tax=Jimgerdemannia flammicorona TaxID=994334 RepID=A0A433Q5X0_9FUNG|nr:hypothetical protein BC938DRAFT_472534 [Jimgerdemannia flammicorona]
MSIFFSHLLYLRACRRKKNNPHDNNTASSGGKHPTKKPSAVTSASSTSSPAAGRALPPNPGSLSPSGDSSVAPPPSASRPRTRGRRLELIFDDVTHNDMSSDQPPPSRPKTYIPARTYSKKGGRSSKR